MGLNNDASLQLHYKFDEAAGATTFTDSAGTNHGTQVGTLTAGSVGQFGNALTFPNAATDYVTLDSTITILADTAFTVSVWIWVADIADPGYIIAGDANNFFDTWTLNRLRMKIAGVGGIASALTDTYSAETWHHVTIARNVAGLVKMYLDGVFQLNHEITMTGAWPISTVGRDYANSYPWSGRLDDLRIYSRELSTSEIKTLATNPYTNAAITPGVSSNIVLPIAYSPDQTQY